MKLSNQLRIPNREVIVFQLLSANIGQLWLKITENWSTWIDETTKNLSTQEPSVFRASSANFPILVENNRNTIGSSFSILSHSSSVPSVNNLKVEVFDSIFSKNS